MRSLLLSCLDSPRRVPTGQWTGAACDAGLTEDLLSVTHETAVARDHVRTRDRRAVAPATRMVTGARSQESL
ncbi:hypothetical protein GCM10009832_01510 [Dietzia kunjamensis subsp. schimae]